MIACEYIYIKTKIIIINIYIYILYSDRPVVCKCKKRSSVDEHADHLFNCHLFTAEVKDRHDAIVHEVHSLSQHAAKSFSFPKYGDFRFENSHWR